MFPKYFPKYLIIIDTFLYFMVKQWFIKDTLTTLYKHQLIKVVIISSSPGGTTFIQITTCFCR